MKKLSMLALLLAIVACNNDIVNLELNVDNANREEVITIDDTLSLYNLNRLYIPENWYDVYCEPYLITVRRSHTINSPVNQGSVIINYTVSYYCSHRLDNPQSKALVEVNDISTSFVRNTTKYLGWSDGGSLAGPVNIQLDVNTPQRFVDCRIIGTIRGEASFWFTNNSGEHIERINHIDSFSINNY